MRKIALYALVLLVAAVACKKTEKGENQRWKNGVKTIDELKVWYPGFKAPLEAQLKKAQAAMDAAKAVSDEKQRVKQMSSANNMLTAGFVTQLKDIDAKKKAIQAKIVEVTGTAGDKSDRASAKQAADNAKKAVQQVEALLKKGAPDAKTANIVLKKAVGDLTAAEQVLATASNISAQKKGPQPAAGKPGTGADAKKVPVTPPDPAKQPWTCEYCSHENAGDKHSCDNCGAARAKK